MSGTGTPHIRAPGSFSAVVGAGPGTLTTSSSSTSSRPALRKVESSSSEDTTASQPLHVPKLRASPQHAPASTRPSAQALYSLNTGNGSTSSLQNFSRPSAGHTRSGDLPPRNSSPLTQSSSSGSFLHGHGRKHSSTQGSFEPYLPTAATSNLGNMANMSTTTTLTASQIAAQAAMQHQTLHKRQRSQTAPTSQTEGNNTAGKRQNSRGPTSPPILSLTEASAPKESSFGGQVYQHGLLGGSHGNAAQTAASLVFPKSPVSSPNLAPVEQMPPPEKPSKSEKSKVKLFSRPGKIGISKDKDTKAPLPSPNKMAFARSNHSTISLADSMSSAASMYSMTNSSTATIRQIETQQPEKEKEKEKHKHHFLSRQKLKLNSKDDHHLPLSSAASNSKPVDPAAPSSLYNFNLPPSPGPTSTSFAKSMSGLDLRHGGRALREKKKEEKIESELSYQVSADWPGPSSVGSIGATSYLGAVSSSLGYSPSVYGNELNDLSKYGLNNMGPDDAWPYLRAKLLIIFEGEDLRLPIEDFNRLVTLHLQTCIRKRTPQVIVEDLRDLLHTGFSSLDQTLRRTPDDRLIPHLVEMWLFTFTIILPYMQAVFLPLDLEFSGHGSLLTLSQANDFWGEASHVLEVRRIVLTSYRDAVILPRFDTLKTIFSRLSLDSFSLNIPGTDILSSSPDSFSGGRPGTAMSLDPAHASYGSQNTTLLDSASTGNRSRAISNVSHGSDPSSTLNLSHTLGLGLGLNIPSQPYPPPPQRPFTPSSTHPIYPSASSHPFNLGHNTTHYPSFPQQRQQTVEDTSKQLTETVGRMLQCVSVLASVGVGKAGDVDAQKGMEELCRGLKLNWLGRGRMGRERRGFVGGRVAVGSTGLGGGLGTGLGGAGGSNSVRVEG